MVYNFVKLGWYRECNIIRHTTDIDLFMWATEYEKSFKKRFLGDKTLNFFMQHGFVNDSFEQKIWGWPCDSPVDIIYAIKYNETTQWNGFHVGSKKFKYDDCFPLSTIYFFRKTLFF